ncbi:MAG: molecular chaperone TorD family protein [Acidobacteria bacterium]|nr:molecular chaperone TorD family protein [Acidobacteriota bacterium]
MTKHKGQMTELARLLARRELWLLVSAGFVDPYHRQRFELLKDPAFRRRSIDAAALLVREVPDIELGPGEEKPQQLSPKDLFAALDIQEVSMEALYRQVFGLTAVSQQCPPCEVEFEPNADVTYRSQRFGDVAGFYQAFGLEVSNRAGERLDHITVEAEFLYLLLAKEAAALYEGNLEGAEICREARRKFFQEHVGWWLPAFTRALSQIAPPGYYQRLATLAAGMSALERVSLELPPFIMRHTPKPSAVEAETACIECPSHP